MRSFCDISDNCKNSTKTIFKKVWKRLRFSKTIRMKWIHRLLLQNLFFLFFKREIGGAGFIAYIYKDMVAPSLHSLLFEVTGKVWKGRSFLMLRQALFAANKDWDSVASFRIKGLVVFWGYGTAFFEVRVFIEVMGRHFLRLGCFLRLWDGIF